MMAIIINTDFIYQIIKFMVINYINYLIVLPHSVVMIEEVEQIDVGLNNLNESQLSTRSSSPSNKKERAKWDIPFSDLAEKEKAGRGSTGDFIHCIWNGQDVLIHFSLFFLLFYSLLIKVVAKVLLNQ